MPSNYTCWRVEGRSIVFTNFKRKPPPPSPPFLVCLLPSVVVQLTAKKIFRIWSSTISSYKHHPPPLLSSASMHFDELLKWMRNFVMVIIGCEYIYIFFHNLSWAWVSSTILQTFNEHSVWGFTLWFMTG